MIKKILALTSLGVGVFILVQVAMPLVSYKLWEATVYSQNTALLSPDVKENAAGISLKEINSFPALVSTNQRTTAPPYPDFSLSIPSVKLDQVKVIVDTNDFEQNLSHLLGSALPGEKGNVFITGHSSLPQFYRPGNFKAIFAHLPEVKKGEEIILNAGGQTFRYKIIGLKIVNPKETWVINPPDDQGRYLSLMTCVPPGLYLKRLIVLASLEN